MVRAAREQAARTRQPFAEILEHELNCSTQEFVERLAKTFDFRPIGLHEMLACEPAFDVVSYADAARRECAAIKDKQGRLYIVLSNPYDADLQNWIENKAASQFSYRVSHRLDVLAYLAKQEESLRAVDAALLGTSSGGASEDKTEDLSLQAIGEYDSPIVKLVNSTLYDALKTDASDIHLETVATGLVIKNRIDGVLVMIGALQGMDLAEQVISRIKVMAELDIAERRIPQDGRFRAGYKGRDIDFRVSIMPSIHGEDAVLRILDKRHLTDQLSVLNLEQLGFDNPTILQLRKLAAQPYGMLLVTGPTGSGKTTTLYAVISEINSGLDKIITIEDPVEYQLPGVLQIPVNEKKGLTFARGLRSILRHDPDKIMVGEIRDPETAEIAIQSALTGHLVYTTVHANNAIDVMGRFMHMRVDPFSFVAALNCVMAQRLIRINCPHCLRQDVPDQTTILASGISPERAGSFKFMRSAGCGQCRGSGFRGRKAIGELLVLNDEIRELIASRAPIRQLKEAARAGGTRFLRDTALDLVQNGETTLAEINRVTFVA
jgi:general secretion pathway protein E